MELEGLSLITERIMKAREFPKTKKTDEQLGVSQLTHVLPDTWYNVPWVVSHSAQVFTEIIRERVREIDTMKGYVIEENISNL